MNSTDRANARRTACSEAVSRKTRKFNRPTGADGRPVRTADFFGCNTFSFQQMENALSPGDIEVLRGSAVKKEALTPKLAETVAHAVKEWALSRGASHYCHWFQPQTGATAEKHDSFLSFNSKGEAIDRFTGEELMRQEPDASSFPSGGRRSTFEARGYTVWDASSPMFLMETDSGLTLCIPSLFVSYSGEALDKKTPLLRSIQVLSDKASDSLKLLGEKDVNHVMATAGPEQEYFVIDNAFHALRPDLVLTGRTLIGKTPQRHQQLEDHYFGAIKPRILNFMMECEYELYKLGVPCKTRHNEVAPSQCETAPIFEFANVAADHNQLVIEVTKQVAKRHDLVALFNEKPFTEINGSGKHLNWSMADSLGRNLLNPGEDPHSNVQFLYFLTATIKAIHDSGHVLRMAVANPGNDFRLGANEAPPAIMSVFLGETLTHVLDSLVGESNGSPDKLSEINLDLARVPVVSRDNTDRNRTSPFAFTGNKFEFRALGSSASISYPLTFLNAAVAKSLSEMNERLRSTISGQTATEKDVLKLIKQVIKETKNIRFEGNNYSEEWHNEAEKRGLPNLRTTPDALKVLTDEDLIKDLSELGVMSKEEILARYNVKLERYNKIRMIEIDVLEELVSTHIYPAALAHQTAIAEMINQSKSAGAKISSQLTDSLNESVAVTESLSKDMVKLRNFSDKMHGFEEDDPKLGDLLADEGMELMEKVRQDSDKVESMVDDQLWSLPKYLEMLYLS